VTLEKMQQLLGLESVPEAFPALYAEMEDTWKCRMDTVLGADFIQKTLEEAFCLEPWRELILEAAAQLRENEALCLLVCLLEAWIREGGAVNDPQYRAPRGEGLLYDFLHLFPAIPTMPESVAYLRRRGVPEDVIVSTMGEYDFCVNMCLERTGKPAFDRGRLNWICRVIRNQLIRIERFKYDLPGKFMTGVRVYRNAAGELTVLADGLRLHRGGRILGSAGHTEEEGSFIARITETEDAVTGYPSLDGIVQKETVTLSKKDWQLWLTEEDCFPRIHIPSDGGFDKKTIAHAYARAREVFDRCYPDYPYKGFFCSSWLMSTDLKEVLKPTSNILGFQEPFTQIPHLSSGRLVFSFVFGLSAAIPEDIDALPEKSSLQRAVKERYKAGGFIHEGAGFFL